MHNVFQSGQDSAGVTLSAYGTSVIREPSARHAERAPGVRAERVPQWVLAAPGITDRVGPPGRGRVLSST